VHTRATSREQTCACATHEDQQKARKIQQTSSMCTHEQKTRINEQNSQQGASHLSANTYTHVRVEE
jgi:hypothetical protein